MFTKLKYLTVFYEHIIHFYLCIQRISQLSPWPRGACNGDYQDPQATNNEEELESDSNANGYLTIAFRSRFDENKTGESIQLECMSKNGS